MNCMLIGCSLSLSVGMSEVTGPSITNIIQPGKFKSGSVGRPLAGIEVKLDESASPVEGQGEVGVVLLY